MNTDRDAFGHALYDHLQNAGKDEWATVIERDDGLVDVIEAQEYFTPYADWPAHQQQALAFARGRVLDIGCGAGRHSLHLQAQGLDVLGVDESPLAIETCKLRGLQQARVMSITQLSSGLGTFDAILMLGNNFGLFANPVRAGWLLRRFAAMTSPAARIIAETLDPYPASEPLHLAYHQRNRERGRWAGQITIRVRYRNYATPWFDYLFVSREELRGLLEGTGWVVERLIDSADARYIAILAKESQ
jgi:SAM-dependent methyltransferase